MPQTTLDEFGGNAADGVSENDDSPAFYWTGHPFVDAGLSALLLYNKKENPSELTEEDIEKTIEFLSELYSPNSWTKYLNKIFRNNNPILMLNPSMKDRTKEKLYDTLYALYELTKRYEITDRRCSICGRRAPIDNIELRKILKTKERNKPKEITGDIFPLLGTGDVPNFFPNGNILGENICAHCLFLSQISPVGMYPIGNKKGDGVKGVLSIHAYPYEKMLFFLEDAVGVARRESLFPDSGAFKIKENLIINRILSISRTLMRENAKDFWKPTKVTAYYFLNGNRTNEQRLDIMPIPTNILIFLGDAANDPGWKRIVNSGWVKPKKKENPEILQKETANEVYNKLLNNESILNYFFDSNKKNTNSDWHLLKIYCMEVLGMDKKTIEIVKKIGDHVVETLDKLEDKKVKEFVRDLENANRYGLEVFFINIEKQRIKNGFEKTMLSFDELSSLLIVNGDDIETSWSTVKNLLLFRIYEMMHDRLVEIFRKNEIGGENNE